MTDVPHPARTAVEQHAARWNAQDRERWLELFADEIVFEDPVGKAPKPGRAAAEGSWDNSFTEGRVWTLHPERIVTGGDEAVVVMRNEGEVHGEHAVVNSIEIWEVRDDGKVVSVRAFFEQPTDVALNPYFVPED